MGAFFSYFDFSRNGMLVGSFPASMATLSSLMFVNRTIDVQMSWLGCGVITNSLAVELFQIP